MTNSAKTNPTHRKRLARMLAEATGLPYQQALDRVLAASNAGLLPSPLDAAGRDAALRILQATEAAAPTAAGTPGPFPPAAGAPVHKARPGTAQDDSAGQGHCAVCMQRVKRVPGGTGPTWIHTDSGAVVGSGADPDDAIGAAGPNNPDRPPLARPSTAFERPAGNVYNVPDDGNPSSLENVSERPSIIAPSLMPDDAEQSAPSADTSQPNAESSPATGSGSKFVAFVAHEGNPVPRCTTTSWRGGSGIRAGHGYGPGGYNRCVMEAGHTTDRHVDEWGNVFTLSDEGQFRAIGHISQEEVALLAAEAGMRVHRGGGQAPEGVETVPRYSPAVLTTDDLKPGMLVQTPDREVLKVSTIYHADRVSAQVLYPMPPRTTVRFYTAAEVATWREASKAMIAKYEEAWGLEPMPPRRQARKNPQRSGKAARRPIRTAQPGDVLTDTNGMWMVDDIEVLANKKVRLKVRSGSTDRGHWTPEHDPETEVDLYTPDVQL